MFNEKSKLKELYRTPAGKDFLDQLARALKRPGIFKNPLVRNLPVSAIERLTKSPGIARTLLHLVESGMEPAPKPRKLPPVKRWWKEAVIYQIYPRSFLDTDGDGIGDLKGILRRIPYLKELGVTAVWLSPVYDSPGDDMGYDIRDYKSILKEFGSMADFDALLLALHASGIRLIMDLVLNHTSDEHAWFRSALKSKDSPYHDYYIWADGKDGDISRPPNNWTSFFSGPAWNEYPQVGQWALHLFSKKQMDLNWENQGLRSELFEMIKWWRNKGVDGFRLDVINLISKGSLHDGNELVGRATGYMGIEHYVHGPHLHEYLRELRENALHDAFAVGEPAGLGMELAKLAAAEERGELDMVFNFDHLDSPGESRSSPYIYDLRALKPYFIDWQTNFSGSSWPALVFENHDNPRMISKIDPLGKWSFQLSTLLAVLQFTLLGTPFVYQGQELSMAGAVFSSAEEFRDVEAIGLYNRLLETHTQEEAFRIAAFGARDHARIPMQWDAAPGYGFTTGTPWLTARSAAPHVNAQAQMADAHSVFYFFKRLIAMRKGSDTLIYGAFRPVFTRDAHTFCYYREDDNECYYMELNLTQQTRKRRKLPEGYAHILGNYESQAEKLRPYEANVYVKHA